jgi:sugar phosphate isomerase/epimerase
VKLALMSNTFRYKPPADAFTAIVRGGFKHVELATLHCDYDWSPERVRDSLAALAAAGLDAPTFYAYNPRGPTADLGKALDRAFEMAAAAGAWGVVHRGPTDDAFYATVSELCERHGIDYVLECDSLARARVFAERSRGRSPRLGIALDNGWFTANFDDPLALFDLCPDQIVGLHLKDCREVGHHRPCRLGEGVSKAADVMARARELPKVRFVTIENEIGRNLAGEAAPDGGRNFALEEILYPDDAMIDEIRRARDWALGHGATE